MAWFLGPLGFAQFSGLSGSGLGSYLVKSPSPSPTFGLGLRPDPPLIFWLLRTFFWLKCSFLHVPDKLNYTINYTFSHFLHFFRISSSSLFPRLRLRCLGSKNINRHPKPWSPIDMKCRGQFLRHEFVSRGDFGPHGWTWPPWMNSAPRDELDPLGWT
jgi:hypothetical protein